MSKNSFIKGPCLAFSAWDPHTNRNRMGPEKRVVNKNFSREASVSEMIRTLNWIPLQELRAKVTTVFKALNNIVDIPYNDLPRSTRDPLNFFIPFARHHASTLSTKGVFCAKILKNFPTPFENLPLYHKYKKKLPREREFPKS